MKAARVEHKQRWGRKWGGGGGGGYVMLSLQLTEGSFLWLVL